MWFTPSFNEAGANWPRNWRMPLSERRTAPYASMRPGPIGPGILRPRCGPTSARNCFNEAGANWPRNCRAVADELHDFAASMRPGPIGPGIDRTA